MNPFRPLRLASFALLALAAGAQAEKIYGLTTVDGSAGVRLVSFDTGNLSAVTPIGLLGVANVRAIDFRPATGTLYALAASGTAAQLYTVSLSTGAATAVGSGFTLAGNASTRVSIDFNPAVDRLRVVTGSGQNYRVNPITGALVQQDTNLAFVAGDQNSNPAGIVADVAYTNNVNGASSSTLYGYYYNTGQIVRIGSPGGAPVSPNTGQMTTIGTTGNPLANGAAVGFDISGTTGLGYVSLNATGSSNTELYTANLATGTLTQLGADDALPVLLDISAAPAVPEPASMLALGAGALALARRRRKA